jgi:uncharacterized protein YwgA
MKIRSSTPWHQYGVISYLAQKLEGRNKLGKKAVQKLIYLIQELSKIPIGYRFHFYHYGPYSNELSGDLEYVANLKGITMQYNPSLNMYNITHGENTHAIISKASSFIKSYEDGISKIINDFGGKRGQDLELIATIIYVWKDSQEKHNYDEYKIISQVAELKPKFNRDEIERNYDYLKKNRYIT